VLSCVGRGLCDGLVTRPEESYRMYQLYVIKKPEWLRKNLCIEEKVIRKKRKYLNTRNKKQVKSNFVNQEQNIIYHRSKLQQN
jgi:hypothetical protein